MILLLAIGLIGILILVTVNAGMRLYPLWQERQIRQKVNRVHQDMRILAAALEAYQADLISRTASNPLPASPEKHDGSTSPSLQQITKYVYDPTNGTTSSMEGDFWLVKQ
jgi:hypothetical protein